MKAVTKDLSSSIVVAIAQDTSDGQLNRLIWLSVVLVRLEYGLTQLPWWPWSSPYFERSSIPISSQLHRSPKGVSFELFSLNRPYLWHPILNMNLISPQKTSGVNRKDAGEWSPLWSFNVENWQSIYFITDEMNAVPVAEQEQLLQSLDGVAFPKWVVWVTEQ